MRFAKKPKLSVEIEGMYALLRCVIFPVRVFLKIVFPLDADPDKPSAFNPKFRLCPYLDTINRNLLDFDFEKLCSVSLTRINVYACLVCGKYFQGRGTNTHAYTHSVAEAHHVFLNLHNLKFYCLPDNYEIIGKRMVSICK